MARKRLSPIPTIPSNTPTALRRWMQAMQESIEVRTGRRGDRGEAAVTFNDLLSSGLIDGLGPVDPATGLPRVTGSTGGSSDGEGVVDYPRPSKPENVTANGVTGGIHVLWDFPEDRGFAFAFIYRGDSVDFEQASLLSATAGASFFDVISTSDEVTYYYWVRFQNLEGELGPLSDFAQGTKRQSTEALLEQLAEDLDSEPSNAGSPDETFILHAKRFALRAGPSDDPVYPLVVTTLGGGGDPVVVMNTALIGEASIDSAQIGSVRFGQVTDDFGTPVTTVGGLLRADAIDADNLNVNSAATFTGDVFSNNYVPGQTGWALLQSGYAEFNDAMIRGNLEVKSITVNGNAPFEGFKAAASNINHNHNPSNDQTFSHTYYADTDITEMPENSKLEMYVYPRMTVSASGTAGGYVFGDTLRGDVDFRTVARVRLYVDGNKVMDQTKTILDKHFASNNGSSYSFNGSWPGANGGIYVDYNYPTYKASSNIEVRFDLTTYYVTSGYTRTNPTINCQVTRNNAVTGDLFRLG